MLSLSRRSALSLAALTALATALGTQTAQAASGTLELNGPSLPSGSLRFTPLGQVAYTCPFAQAFKAQAKTFTATSHRGSDALVQATFHTARPAAGNIYARVLARRTDNGADYYSAVLNLDAKGQLILTVERTIKQKTSVLARRVLPFSSSTGEGAYELSLSVRATRLVAQVLVPGRAAQTLEFNDAAVPFNATPGGKGTGLSLYAGGGVARNHSVRATAATSGPWGIHRGSKTLPGWGKLIFEDDFDTATLDTRKWNVRHQDYVSYDSGVNLKEMVDLSGDSTAKLWMKKLAKPVRFSDGKNRPWGTGYLDTIGKFSANYFRLEYRAKHPASHPHQVGVWGGMWMRPDKTSLAGEIDLAESYGYHAGKQSIVSTNMVESTVHFGKQANGKSDKQGSLAPVLGQSLADEFHVWAVEKTPAGIRFFFDGVQFHFVPASYRPYAAAIPASAKFHLRLNMQAGNSYWGWPNGQTRDSALEVDYVRVWEYKG